MACPTPGLQLFTLPGFFGLTDELHQLAVPGRDFELTDLLANGIGALAGVMFIKGLSCRSTPKEKNTAKDKIAARARADRKRK
ncbi:MAG TPA: hypothetical protein DCQ14_02135 [Firmicutes bacterium]|nr:hypothetical protein [Bacillota bacterium]